MNVLIINAGSSSLKYQLMDPETGAVTVLREHLREILIDLAKVQQQSPEIFDSMPLRPVRRLVTTLEPG